MFNEKYGINSVSDKLESKIEYNRKKDIQKGF
jgi:hypothetical protein